jgi:porphobilinogen synthase
LGNKRRSGDTLKMRERFRKFFPLLQEESTTPEFVLPLFVTDGRDVKEPILSMPGFYRLSPENIVAQATKAYKSGVKGVALFPVLPEHKKDAFASESTNPAGLFQQTIKRLKDQVPELAVITDVAMDPYSSDGHDGLVVNGNILNDPTLEILQAMAISQAEAGADIVAPSDMMDYRVGAIRSALDTNGHTAVGILAYSAKYASSFYGPFRDALDSAPRFGDKKTYQMDPANSDEAIKEVLLDIAEGADMVMIKPGLPYLDIIKRISVISSVPVAAYQVSGEYALIKAGSAAGIIDELESIKDSTNALFCAGAKVILSYFAIQAAESLK